MNFIKRIITGALRAALLSALIMSKASSMPLSLNESIELALKNDEKIESAEHSREFAKWNLSAARRSSGMTFSWNSQAYKIGGRDYRSYREAHKRYGNKGSYVFDDNGKYLGFASGSTAYNNTFSNSFNILFPLYTGGQIEGIIKNRRYALNAADLTVENTRQSVKYEVIEAYYNILQNKNLVEINQSAVRMALEQLNLLQIRYEEGETAFSDVLQMQVQMVNYNQSLSTAKSNLKVSEITLLSLLELPEDTDLELTDEFLYLPYDFTLEDCEKYAFENRPDLAVANYNVNQAEAAVSSAKSGNRPSVTGSASRSISANGAFQSERSETWQIGISLNWNIFDNQVTSANVKAAKSEVERLRATAEGINKSVLLQVRSAYFQMKAAEENIKLTRAAISQAERSYEIAVIRHVEGVDILLSVTDAQEKLTQARINYYTALYQYNLHKAQLEKAMGIPVGLNVPLYIKAEHESKSSAKALKRAEIVPFSILMQKSR